jgi:translation initiation factor 4E
MQLFACIGELFEEPDLVGVVLSSRAREDMVSVWNRDNQAKPDVRQKIG